MGLATSLKTALLDLVFSGTAYTPEATIYIGLSSTTPTVTGGNVTEPSGGDYARVAKTNNGTNWGPAVDDTTSNATAITFPTASATWLAGADLTHVVLYDADVAGTFLGYGALTVAKPVISGDTASFGVNALDIVLQDA
jgi:hypothetical protein